MKKKVLSMLLSAAMISSLLVGCGGKNAETTTKAPADAATEAPADTTAEASTDTAAEASADTASGDKFYIYSWNTELQERLAYVYAANPGMEERIEYVNVGDSNIYQEKIDQLLQTPDAEDYPDMIAFEAGYIMKYTNSDYTLPVTDCGLTDTDVLKKAVGEDTLIYEKKGQDAIHFHSYAKLPFSTNEMPQNLEDKSDAFYRRLLILDMNRVVKSGEKDLHLKEKVQAESDYAIHMAMIALKNLYEQGKFTESEHSKECVREVQRSSDSICAFIDESLVRTKGKRLKRSEVFHMYEEYCKENGRQGHGKSNFFRNMTDKGFLLKQYNGEFYYQDIAVKEEDFCPVDPEERIPFEETDIAYKQLQLNMNQGIKGI